MQRKKAMADVKVKVMKTRLACQDRMLLKRGTGSGERGTGNGERK